MKKFFLTGLIVSLFAFQDKKPVLSSISGTVTPSDAALKVWAISNADTAATVPVAGKFNITVKEGIWNLTVEAAKPYQNATMTGIVVIDNQPNDVGIITLKQ